MRKKQNVIDFSKKSLYSVVPKLKSEHLKWMDVGDSILVQYILKHNTSYFLRVMGNSAKFTQKKMILLDPITCKTIPVSLITRVE